MTAGRGDWLDLIAWRSARGRNRTAHRSEARPSPSNEERFSRSTALKLALAGAASLSLGLGDAPPALAQSRGECFTECLDDHDKELRRRLRSCDDVFSPAVRKKWGVAATYLFPPLSQIKLAQAALTGLCYAQAQHDVGGDKKQCFDRCETTCRRRTTQSLRSPGSRARATCEVTPPRKASSPKVPPPPNPDDDLCLTCMSQGGECCPGGSAASGGMCACATAGVPCSAYEGACA